MDIVLHRISEDLEQRLQILFVLGLFLAFELKFLLIASPPQRFLQVLFKFLPFLLFRIVENIAGGAFGPSGENLAAYLKSLSL